MGFLRALADATLPSVLVAVLAFVASDLSGTLRPAALGLLAGAAVLVGATGVSLRFQTADRRYPLTRVVFELLTLG